MSKKMVVHGLLLGGLLVYTVIAWYEFTEAQQKLATLEAENGSDWVGLDLAESRAETATGMIKVAAPFLVLAIYSGILTVIYALPVLVGKISEGMMGSTAEVDPDPMQEARDLIEEEEYADAIAFCYQLWLKNRDNRRPLAEIARIQQRYLKNPVLAVATLEEGLEDHAWEDDDVAFFLFRIAEIYEEDLEDREKAKEIMGRVTGELEGTRHAANAVQKLRELEAEG
jgi:hypothetical protein